MEKLEKKLDTLTRKLYGRPADQVTDAEMYHVLLQLTKELMKDRKEISGDKKVYYISAEFLIGKLLDFLPDVGLVSAWDPNQKRFFFIEAKRDSTADRIEIVGPDLLQIAVRQRQYSLVSGSAKRFVVVLLLQIGTVNQKINLAKKGFDGRHSFSLLQQSFI